MSIERSDMYAAQFLDSVRTFLYGLPPGERAKIAASVDTMRSGDFDSVFVKTLRTPIKELRIKRTRLLFFAYKRTLYFVAAFTKKTQKAPRKEIEAAERIYKKLTTNKP